MATTQLVTHGSVNITAGSANRYVGFGGGLVTNNVMNFDGNLDTVAVTSGTLSNLQVYVASNWRTQTTFRTRKNGVDGNQVITVGAGQTGRFEATGTDTVAAGDRFVCRINTGDGYQTLTLTTVAVNFTGSTYSLAPLHAATTSGTMINANAYLPVAGTLFGATTESAVTYVPSNNAVAKGASARVAFGGSATTIVLRENGASKPDITLTIPGSATGSFTTTGDVSIGYQNHINFMMGSGGGQRLTSLGLLLEHNWDYSTSQYLAVTGQASVGETVTVAALNSVTWEPSTPTISSDVYVNYYLTTAPDYEGVGNGSGLVGALLIIEPNAFSAEIPEFGIALDYVTPIATEGLYLLPVISGAADDGHPYFAMGEFVGPISAAGGGTIDATAEIGAPQTLSITGYQGDWSTITNVAVTAGARQTLNLSGFQGSTGVGVTVVADGPLTGQSTSWYLGGYNTANYVFTTARVKYVDRFYSDFIDGFPLSHITIRITSNGGTTLRPVVYADDNGVPGALIAQGPTLSYTSGSGPRDLAFSAPVNLPFGQHYWIGFVSGEDNHQLYGWNVAGATARQASAAQASIVATDPFGDSTAFNLRYFVVPVADPLPLTYATENNLSIKSGPIIDADFVDGLYVGGGQTYLVTDVLGGAYGTTFDHANAITANGISIFSGNNHRPIAIGDLAEAINDARNSVYIEYVPTVDTGTAFQQLVYSGGFDLWVNPTDSMAVEVQEGRYIGDVYASNAAVLNVPNRVVVTPATNGSLAITSNGGPSVYGDRASDGYLAPQIGWYLSTTTAVLNGYIRRIAVFPRLSAAEAEAISAGGFDFRGAWTTEVSAIIPAGATQTLTITGFAGGAAYDWTMVAGAPTTVALSGFAGAASGTALTVGNVGNLTITGLTGSVSTSGNFTAQADTTQVLSLTGFEGVARGGLTVAADDAQTLTLSGFQGSANGTALSVAGASQTLAITGFAGGVVGDVLVEAGATQTISFTSEPGDLFIESFIDAGATQTLAITGFAGTVEIGIPHAAIAGPTQVISITGFQGAEAHDYVLEGELGELTITGLAGAVSAGLTVTAGATQVIEITGFAGVPVTDVNAEAGEPQELVVTGLEGAVSTEVVAVGELGEMAITGHAADVFFDWTAVAGDRADLTITGFEGHSNTDTLVEAGPTQTLTIEGLTGDFGGGLTIRGMRGNVTITGFEGQVANDYEVPPGELGELTITGLAGEASGDAVAEAGTTQIVTVTGLQGAPSAGATIEGEPGELAITGFAGAVFADATTIAGATQVIAFISAPGEAGGGALVEAAANDNIEIVGFQGSVSADANATQDEWMVITVTGFQGDVTTDTLVSGGLGLLSITGLIGDTAIFNPGVPAKHYRHVLAKEKRSQVLVGEKRGHTLPKELRTHKLK